MFSILHNNLYIITNNNPYALVLNSNKSDLRQFYKPLLSLGLVRFVHRVETRTTHLKTGCNNTTSNTR